jgi:hypothetical protein
MDLFHNEIISFCLRKATIKLAADQPKNSAASKKFGPKIYL